MPKIIEVIYENEVFKPLEKVDLPEKTRLRIKIEEIDDLEEFCGLMESKISLGDIEKMSYEVRHGESSS